MPTQPFADTLKTVSSENPAFADGLFENAVNALLAGDVDEGRILLRAHVNATVGFQGLSRLTGKHAKSLMRMLGPHGNPTANNLLEIITRLGNTQGVTIEARVTKATSG